MAHTAHACWLSRATAGHLGPGGACHSEPIQSRQPFLSLQSRCSFVGRDLIMPWVDLGFAALGPAFKTHSLLLLAARPSSSEAKKCRVLWFFSINYLRKKIKVLWFFSINYFRNTKKIDKRGRTR